MSNIVTETEITDKLTQLPPAFDLKEYWIGLHLFNDDKRPWRHISRPSQVGFSHRKVVFGQQYVGRMGLPSLSAVY